MPYDLFCTEQGHDSLHTEWEFHGTYAKLWHAQADLARAGEERPALRRWLLMYVRRSTAMLGKCHSLGDYPRKENNDAQ